MYLVPNVYITITTADGKTIVARSANEVLIKKSIHSFVNTATITIPASARLKYSKTGETASAQSAKQFNRGDQVTIEMGYGNNIRQEFKGYIARVNFSIPCVIECEGYCFLLRKVVAKKSWKSVQLKTVLQELIKDTDITIHPDVQDVELKPFYMGMGTNTKTAFGVLQQLAKEKVFVAYFINDTQLYVGLKNLAIREQKVIYKLGYNTINEHELKYRRAEDVKIHVNVTYYDEKGKLRSTTAGNKGGIELNFKFGRLTSADQAKVQALRQAEKHRYEGYEGKVVTFLDPYVTPGMKCDLRDPDYNERDQLVIAETVETRLNRGGVRRLIEVGQKINAQT